MRRIRWIILVVGLLVAVVAGRLWFARPQPVDMAAYAPADSLLYLEANHPLAVADALVGTDAWKAFEKVMGTQSGGTRSQWLQTFIGVTGIGPVQSVVLARAQVAAVVTNLGTTEDGQNLKIKPEGAVLIETHTAEFRIKPEFETALKQLAEKTYGRPTERKFSVNGVEFTEWKAPDGSRQIVGAMVGSLVIVGNTERAVQDCADVALGREPKLKDDPDLTRMRLQLGGDSLAFGYVPSGNSARLLAVGVPLLLGRAPGDAEFQRLIEKGAAKVFGNLGWSSKKHATGIEDRYLIGLQPSIVGRLKPSFRPTNKPSLIERVLPNDFYSVTSYNFTSPAEALQNLRLAVASQVDALSAIVFASLLKATLQTYGIDDPEKFLGAVDGEILTLRLDETAERALLIAGVKDQAALREMIAKKMRLQPGSKDSETFEDSTGDFAASFISDYIVVGDPSDVRRFAEDTSARAKGSNADKLQKLTYFASKSSSANPANIVTYTNDRSRVQGFFSALIHAKGTPIAASGQLQEALTDLPYSVTETSLDDAGLTRVTRSPLGQFSTIFPLLFPEPTAPAKSPTEPR